MKAFVIAAAFYGLCALEAAPVNYLLEVTVTSAPNAPGTYIDNPWNFGSLPLVFQGTFTADNAVSGSISNLQLVIGGIDVAATHTYAAASDFNPATLALKMLLQSLDSAVLLGSVGTFGAPANYAVAVQAGNLAPVDPYYSNTQNWVGTFSVTAIPEPAAMLLTAAGTLAVLVRRRSIN